LKSSLLNENKIPEINEENINQEQTNDNFLKDSSLDVDNLFLKK
jgi:hypothetical protein